MCNLKCCGTFCAGFSAFCGIALVIAGLVIHSGSEVIELEGKKPHNIAHNCFVGALMYAVTLTLSLICLCADHANKARARALALEHQE